MQIAMDFFPPFCDTLHHIKKHPRDKSGHDANFQIMPCRSLARLGALLDRGLLARDFWLRLGQG